MERRTDEKSPLLADASHEASDRKDERQTDAEDAEGAAGLHNDTEGQGRRGTAMKADDHHDDREVDAPTTAGRPA
jgi:hypothetical protein